MNRYQLKTKRYEKRRRRIKYKVRSKDNRLRLCISRSNANFYVQIIDDSKGHSVFGLSTLSKEFASLKNKNNVAAAKVFGKAFAEKAVSKGIKEVVFDRNGYLYHGKIKAFADAARENGLVF